MRHFRLQNSITFIQFLCKEAALMSYPRMFSISKEIVQKDSHILVPMEMLASSVWAAPLSWRTSKHCDIISKWAYFWTTAHTLSVIFLQWVSDQYKYHYDATTRQAQVSTLTLLARMLLRHILPVQTYYEILYIFPNNKHLIEIYGLSTRIIE